MPTSGSQGCTAAVIELVFNSTLVEMPETGVSTQVPVYRGEVEFMSKEEWEKELRVLIRECCNDKGILLKNRPNSKVMPTAAAAWSKINQGKTTGYQFINH